MEKMLWLKYFEDFDSWGDLRGEELHGESHLGTKVDFNAYNLNECPEDAIIGRDLFGASDFIDALNLGIQLAQEGYTGVGFDE